MALTHDALSEEEACPRDVPANLSPASGARAPAEIPVKLPKPNQTQYQQRLLQAVLMEKPRAPKGRWYLAGANTRPTRSA